MSNCKLSISVSDYNQIDGDILKKIDKSDFKEYCKENVKEQSYWTFGKKLTIDQILSYSKTMHAPILNIPKEVRDLAMKNFKSKRRSTRNQCHNQ